MWGNGTHHQREAVVIAGIDPTSAPGSIPEANATTIAATAFTVARTISGISATLRMGSPNPAGESSPCWTRSTEM